MRTSQTIKNRYTVTAGVLAYSANFPMEENTDVAVYLSTDGGTTSSLLTLTTDYTVTIANDGLSGTVTLKPGVAAEGNILSLVSNIPYTQELDLNNVSTINTEATENQLDRTVQMIQQLKEKLDRAVTISVTDNSQSADDLRDTILLGKAEAEKLLESQTAIDRLYISVGNIDTVAGDVTNIDTVAGSIANVNNVSDNMSDVNAIVADMTNIDAVAGDLSNIDTVAGSIANVDAVGGSIANVNSVASSLTDVGAVVSNMSDIVSVANDLTNIGGVAQDLSKVDAVYSSLSDVGIVASNVGDVNTVASSIDDIEHMSLIISSVVPVINGGTGVTSIDDIQAGKDGAGNTITSTYVNVTSAQTVSGAKTFTDSATFSGGIIVSSGATIEGGMTVSGGISGTCTSATDASSLGGIAASGYVTTSGAQTISGAKTFNDAVIVSSIKNSTTSSITSILGSTETENGAAIFLYGKDNGGGDFRVRAANGSQYVDLVGMADGYLGWANKEFVYTTGNQNIFDVKTFFGNPYIYGTYPYCIIRHAEIVKGTAPSTAKVQGFRLEDSNGTLLGSLDYYYPASKTASLSLNVQKAFNSTDTAYIGVNLSYGSSSQWFMPSIDNQLYLGGGSNRWKQLIAGTTSISTSDERFKSNITDIPDAVLDAWAEVNWQQFKFNDAIKEKGSSARLHSGLIAQRIDAVFRSHGLDVSRYGLFCYDEWEAEDAVINEETGHIISPAKEAGNRYSLRYEEALCIEAAYQRRRADRAEARISALERRLEEMEQAIAALAGGAE